MKKISGEHKTTTILPVPINLFAALINPPDAYCLRFRVQRDSVSAIGGLFSKCPLAICPTAPIVKASIVLVDCAVNRQVGFSQVVI